MKKLNNKIIKNKCRLWADNEQEYQEYLDMIMKIKYSDNNEAICIKRPIRTSTFSLTIFPIINKYYNIDIELIHKNIIKYNIDLISKNELIDMYLSDLRHILINFLFKIKERCNEDEF